MTSSRSYRFQDLIDLAKKAAKGKLFSEMSGNELFAPLNIIFNLNDQLTSYILKDFVNNIKDVDLNLLPLDMIDKCCAVTDTFTKEEIEKDQSKCMWKSICMCL